MKKIYIEWYDAYTRDGWESAEDAIKNCKSLMPCKTIGWLLNEDEKQITVCHTFNPSLVMGILHIPKCSIVKMKRY